MSEPTLPEWLLTQIATDEEKAREGLAPASDGDRQYYKGIGAHRDDWGLWTFHVPPARVLAECEAKRRIVETRGAIGIPVGTEMPNGHGFSWLDGAHTAVAAERERTLPLLALPCADRPGWREEWRG